MACFYAQRGTDEFEWRKLKSRAEELVCQDASSTANSRRSAAHSPNWGQRGRRDLERRLLATWQLAEVACLIQVLTVLAYHVWLSFLRIRN